MRPLTASPHPDPAAWNAFVESRQGSLLQTSWWGELKSAFGWSHQIVALADERGRIVAGALLLFRPLPLGMGTIAYVPRGPVVDWQDGDMTGPLLNALDAAARQRRSALLKLEADALDSPEMRTVLQSLGFRESPHTVQPPRTILIDVTGGDEAILARMNQGTRRKIRQSEKKEVAIRRGDTADLESFIHLIAETGRRNVFGVHSPDYYRAAFRLFAPDHATLLMASYAGRDLGGLTVFGLGKTAWYFYGASSDAERERMPTYGLQWAAIQWARERGCQTYDLWGIPDADEAILEAEFQRRSDGLWGVYGFKRGFGGQIARWVGAWDRVYNPALYAAYRLVMTRRTGE